MDIRAHVVALNEKRAKAAKSLNDHLDDCHKRHPGDLMSAEEREVEDRINAEIDALEDEIRRFVAQETREQESDKLRASSESIFGSKAISQADENVDTELRNWLRGGGTSKEFEVKDFQLVAQIKAAQRSGASTADIRNSLLWDTGSVGSAVPTTFASTLYEYFEQAIAMFRAPTTKIVTASGEPMVFPTLATHAIATQVIAQGTAIGGTDPVFDKITLGSYKYGELVKVSSETLEDTSFDIARFVAKDIARALSYVIDADLVNGTGTGEPQGIMTASWGSVATGGTLITPTYENLVDMQYGLADEYANAPTVGWLMRRATAGVFRKLRDGAGGTVGAPLWQPSTTNGITYGQPDMLLDAPVYTDGNVAANGSAAKAVWFGDFASYYLRLVGNPRIERSDDFAFDTDLVTYRGKWRVDGDVIDLRAGVVSHQRT